MRVLSALLTLLIISMAPSVYAGTEYSKKLHAANSSYMHSVKNVKRDHENRTLSGEVASYENMIKRNEERFLLAVGGRSRKVANRPPTEDEMKAVAESLWQHAACIAENELLQDTNVLQDAQKQKVEQLTSDLFKTAQQQGGDKRNARALMHALRYATGYLLGDVDYLKNIKDEAKKHCRTGLLGYIDNYFKDLYDENKKQPRSNFNNSADPSKRYNLLNLGHFTMVIVSPKGNPKVTLLMRDNVVERGESQNMRDSTQNSPFFAVRLQTLAEHKKDQESKMPLFRDNSSSTPYHDMMVAPLKFTKNNTNDYPNHWEASSWARRKNLEEGGYSLYLNYSDDMDYIYHQKKYIQDLDPVYGINLSLTFREDEQRSSQKKMSFIDVPLRFFLNDGALNRFSRSS